jgi:RNA 3'-phosphate cyclase
MMVDLDGSFGEGGGQILRTSLALSLITKKPFHLRNIRAKRPKPGLQPQHLMSVQAAATIGPGTTLRGASLGSSDLQFEPGDTVPGTYHFRIGTAGATSLVLHTIYLPLALADGPSTVTIEGGTHVKASPCFHFLHTSWRAYMAALGISLDLRMHRPGFYPRGGGLIEARLGGSSTPRGLQITSLGHVDEVIIRSAVAGLAESIGRRQGERAYQQLRKSKLKADIHYETWEGGPGTMLAVELPTQPAPTLFFGLGERGKPAERVADEAVHQVTSFLRTEPTGVDGHSADQLLLPLSLAEEGSAYKVAEISQHLLTNVAVIRRFLEREIVCEGQEGSEGVIRIK